VSGFADLVSVSDPASLDQVFISASVIDQCPFWEKSIVKKSYSYLDICLRKILLKTESGLGNNELVFGKQFRDQIAFATWLVSTFTEQLHDSAENKCPV
jgi:hypothetical protein